MGANNRAEFPLVPALYFKSRCHSVLQPRRTSLVPDMQDTAVGKLAVQTRRQCIESDGRPPFSPSGRGLVAR